MVAPGEEKAQDKERPEGKGKDKGEGKRVTGRGRERVQGFQTFHLSRLVTLRSKKCKVYPQLVQGRVENPAHRLLPRKAIAGYSGTAIPAALMLMCGFRQKLTSWIQGCTCGVEIIGRRPL